MFGIALGCTTFMKIFNLLLSHANAFSPNSPSSGSTFQSLLLPILWHLRRVAALFAA